jgi:hypothetical protein
MKRKLFFLTGLLIVSAALIFVSALEAKACESGGDKECYQPVLADCVDLDENGNLIVTGHYFQCAQGSTCCVATDCV